MDRLYLALRQWPLAMAYFLAASLTILLTRETGSVAMLWVATGLLVGVLVYRPRRAWGPALVASGIGSAVATALFGFGPAGAIPFALVNMAEAGIGARLFNRIDDREWEPFDSLRWVIRICMSVGLVAPMSMAVPAGLIAAWYGQPFWPAVTLYFCGHALGGLTITPLVLTVANKEARTESLEAIKAGWRKKAVLLALVACTIGLVFSQHDLPLLFLPLLPMILATFHCGRETAALSVVILALVGGGLTMAGHGPIFLTGEDAIGRMLFFQFYLAVTVMTILPVAADLHAKRRILRAVAVSEEKFRLIADHSTDVLLQLDLDGRVLYASPAIHTLGGYDGEALVGQPVTRLIDPGDQQMVIDRHRQLLDQPLTTHAFEYRARLTNGSVRWFESHARAVLSTDGRVEGSVSIIRDIEARKEMEQRLTLAAFTDPLTGLPNRRSFREQAERRAHERKPAVRDCIAIFDIDHFKRVNDLFGHDIGDLVLQHFAVVARSMLRDSDVLARFGGEEFVVLMPDTATEQALSVCDRLRREIALTPLCAQHQVVRLTVSGGVAQLGLNGLDAALKVADLALYQAKEGGRDQLLLAA